MSDKPIDHSAYDAFATEAERRRELCLRQIEPLAQAGPSRSEASARLRLTIHDIVGEARFLGLTELSTTALELAQLVDALQDQLGVQAVRDRLRAWVEALFDSVTLSATTVGDAGQSELLGTLRREMARVRGEPRPSGAATHAPAQATRVLVLDDSEIVRYLLESHLESKGFTALTVASYEQLEARIGNFEPQMVLVDINMPGIKGDEVCRRLRRRAETKGLQIVLMSSLSDGQLAEIAARAGADGFLSKQQGMEELARYLDQLLAALPPPRRGTVEGDENAARSSGARRRREDATLSSFAATGAGAVTPPLSAAGGSLTEALEAAASALEDEEKKSGA